MHESEELVQEAGAIEAIYPECIEKLFEGVYKLRIPQHEHILFQMSFPEDYPESKPYILDVVSEKEGFDEKYLMELFQDVLDSIYHEGVVVIFDLFTELEAVLHIEEDADEEIKNEEDHWGMDESNVRNLATNLEASKVIRETGEEEEKKKEEQEQEQPQSHLEYVYAKNKEKRYAKTGKPDNYTKPNKMSDPLDGWIISEPISDRKSTFVAFAKEVHSLDDAYMKLSRLMEDKKVSRANHAMRAWRIKDGEKGVQYQDCDDDGETAAGGRMLHLMSIMDAWNVMVVCCRWFGGVHIGPDRFKHINSTTRDVLVKGNFVDIDSKKSKKKRK